MNNGWTEFKCVVMKAVFKPETKVIPFAVPRKNTKKAGRAES